jgi:hypothetical protein
MITLQRAAASRIGSEVNIMRTLTFKQTTIAMSAMLFCRFLVAAEPATSYPMDAGQADYEKKYAVVMKECTTKEKNVVRQGGCIEAGRAQIFKTSQPRGYEYGKAHYENLSLQEIEDRYMALRPLLWAARSKEQFNSYNPKPVGEVTREMIETEMDMLDSRRYARTRIRFDSRLKLSPAELEVRKDDAAYVRRKEEEFERARAQAIKDALKQGQSKP